MNRQELADNIVTKLRVCKRELQTEFLTPNRVNSFVVDDVLPEKVAHEIYAAFPAKEQMVQRKDLREYKYVAAQMNLYNPLLEEIVFAFQDPRILAVIEEITKIEQLLPDPYLYAGGISLMSQDNFLNPHLDNSHDKFRLNYRALNLLYYVTPDWKLEYGGNLELWDDGPGYTPRTIVSKINRLVVMITNRSSWHSVSKVAQPGQRCCISNYYFSPVSFENKDYYHVTSFRGRPEQKVRDLVLQADNGLRNAVRKVVKADRSFHFYKK